MSDLCHIQVVDNRERDVEQDRAGNAKNQNRFGLS